MSNTSDYSSRRPRPDSPNHLARRLYEHIESDMTLDELRREKPVSLKEEIEQAINRCNAESQSNTPDWILAQYLIDCLDAFDKAVTARTAYYSTDEEGDRNDE